MCLCFGDRNCVFFSVTAVSLSGEGEGEGEGGAGAVGASAQGSREQTSGQGERQVEALEGGEAKMDTQGDAEAWSVFSSVAGPVVRLIRSMSGSGADLPTPIHSPSLDTDVASHPEPHTGKGRKCEGEVEGEEEVSHTGFGSRLSSLAAPVVGLFRRLSGASTPGGEDGDETQSPRPRTGARPKRSWVSEHCPRAHTRSHCIHVGCWLHVLIGTAGGDPRGGGRLGD